MPVEQVTIFHGTRTSRLAEIKASGFRGVDLLAEIETTATRHGFSTEKVVDFLDQNGSFIVVDFRSNSTAFSLDFDTAAEYASRAPEVIWETLVAIYRLQHPELGDYWNQSEALHWWVTKNLGLDDEPVVIALEMSLNALVKAQVDDGYSLEQLRGSFELQSNPKMSGGPEVTLETPLHQPIASEKLVPLRIDISLARHLAGFAPDAEGAQMFGAEVDAGKWGTVLADSRSSVMGKFFDWCEFRTHLPQDRLSYLLNAD